MRLEFIGNCIIFFAALFGVLARDSIESGLVGLSITVSLRVRIFVAFHDEITEYPFLIIMSRFSFWPAGLVLTNRAKNNFHVHLRERGSHVIISKRVHSDWLRGVTSITPSIIIPQE